MQNGSGQEHSSSSSLSSELIHSKGDQPTTPLLLPRYALRTNLVIKRFMLSIRICIMWNACRSELLDENGCTNTSAVNNSSLEDETATLQTQMNSTLENDTAAQDLFPPLTVTFHSLHALLVCIFYVVIMPLVTHCIYVFFCKGQLYC